MKLEAVLALVESEEGYDRLEELVEDAKETAASKLEMLEYQFGSDTETLLENLLNTTDNVAEVLAMMCLREEEQLDEIIVKRVNAQGQISRVKDRKTRARLATQTTGLAKSKRRLIARKAAKTKKARPSIKVKAVRKFRRALKRRRSMGM